MSVKALADNHSENNKEIIYGENTVYIPEKERKIYSKEEVKEIAKPAVKEEKSEVAIVEKPEPKPVVVPKVEAPKLVVEVDEIEEEEQPEDLVDLSKSIRESLSTLEKMKKRVEYDMQYINNWSFWLDLKILVETIPALLRDEAY